LVAARVCEVAARAETLERKGASVRVEAFNGFCEMEKHFLVCGFGGSELSQPTVVAVQEPKGDDDWKAEAVKEAFEVGK